MASNQIAFRSYYDDKGMLVWYTYSRVNSRAVFCIEPHCGEESCWLGGRCESCEQAEESCLLGEPTGEQAEESCTFGDGCEAIEAFCPGCDGPSSPGANGYCVACWTQRYGCVEEPSPCAQCGETFDVGLALDISRCPRCILSPCCAPQPVVEEPECNTCGCTTEFRDGERICWCDACQKDGCRYGDDCICCYQKDYARSGKTALTREDILIEIKNSETMLTWDRKDDEHAMTRLSLECLYEKLTVAPPSSPTPADKPAVKCCTDCGVERPNVEPVLLGDWFCRPCWQEQFCK